MEIIQLESERGSQRWLQRGVNGSPDKLNSLILKHLHGASTISWFSRPFLSDSLLSTETRIFLNRLVLKICGLSCKSSGQNAVRNGADMPDPIAATFS
jgi:hypothetical protein